MGILEWICFIRVEYPPTMFPKLLLVSLKQKESVGKMVTITIEKVSGGSPPQAR